MKEVYLFMSEAKGLVKSKLNANPAQAGAKLAKAPRKAPPVSAEPDSTEDVKDKASKVMQPETIEPIPLTPAQEKAAKQELIAPHEWASLLNAPENETEDTYIGSPDGLAELDAADELWERLSSTRWIKEPKEDFHNSTTVANRPAAS